MAVLNNNVELHNVVLSPEEKLWRAVMAINLDSDTVHKKMNTKIRQKQFIERIEKI
jgi:hypothetical protein